MPREDRCHEECPQCIQDTTHNGGPARVHQVTSGAAAIIPVILRRVVHVRGMRNVINVSKRTVDMYIGAIYKTVRYSTRIYYVEYEYHGWYHIPGILRYRIHLHNYIQYIPVIYMPWIALSVRRAQGRPRTRTLLRDGARWRKDPPRHTCERISTNASVTYLHELGTLFVNRGRPTFHDF